MMTSRPNSLWLRSKKEASATSTWRRTASRYAMPAPAETAVFWYKPEDSETYKVIYGDLAVKDVAEKDLPTKPAKRGRANTSQ